MDATSQIVQEAMDAILNNIQDALTGIGVGLNWKRAWVDASANFLFKSNVEKDNMNIEEVSVYAKACHDRSQDLICHKEEGMALVCVNV